MAYPKDKKKKEFQNLFFRLNLRIKINENKSVPKCFFHIYKQNESKKKGRRFQCFFSPIQCDKKKEESVRVCVHKQQRQINKTDVTRKDNEN